MIHIESTPDGCPLVRVHFETLGSVTNWETQEPLHSVDREIWKTLQELNATSDGKIMKAIGRIASVALHIGMRAEVSRREHLTKH